MEKLLTVYLDNSAYAEGKLVGSFAEKHGLVEEHLQSYLSEGWKVKQLSVAAGGADVLAVRGWLTVVLEKNDR